MLREAVEVETVIPVCASDERQGMRSEMCCGISEALPEMIKERFGVVFIAVISALLIENAEVAGLLYVSRYAGYEPERIVIETASDGHVAALCQRLILMIGASVRELRVCYVYDPLTGSFRYQMNESEKILARIAESHAASEAAFIVAGRSAHVERHHALILIPGVYSSVELFIA